MLLLQLLTMHGRGWIRGGWTIFTPCERESDDLIFPDLGATQMIMNNLLSKYSRGW